MTTSSVSRRGFLGVVAGAAAAACTGGDDPAADVGKETDGRPAPGEYAESPMLTELVDAGELPPVADRLPTQPYIVQPGLLLDEESLSLESGTFGGTLQLAQEGPGGDPVLFVALNEPLLWAPNAFDYPAGIEGNVAAGWESNADNTRFTFFLRDGLRWSDGELVTMDDVRFAFEDVLFNGEVTPVFPAYLRSGNRADGTPAEFEVVDDLTFTLSFDRPYGSFPVQVAIAEWHGYDHFIKPRHYLEQFHTDYADPDDLAELMRTESVPEGEWFNLFNARQLGGNLFTATTEQAIGHPTLTPWVMTRTDDGVFTYERNPYYFKVDAEGNQLPYIDSIRSQVVQDYETLTSRALFGEFDYLGERAGFRTLPLMREKEEAGDIKILISRQHAAPLTVWFNLTIEDEPWHEIVRDLRFRRALSLAINYDEIIETLYLGEFASVPSRSSPGEYDVDEANRLLDEMGLDARDEEEFRLGPDGQRVEIRIELAGWTENHMPATEFVAEYWNDLGISTSARLISDLGERLAANDLQATTMFNAEPLWHALGWNDYLPLDRWAPRWQEWYGSNGEAGEEPPAEVQELFELHDTLTSAHFDSPESRAAFEAIERSHHDNLWNLQLVEDAYIPTFFTTRVHNVPTGIRSEAHGIIVSYSMEQWYLAEE